MEYLSQLFIVVSPRSVLRFSFYFRTEKFEFNIAAYNNSAIQFQAGTSHYYSQRYRPDDQLL